MLLPECVNKKTDNYHSAFDSWYESSSIRVKPHRTIQKDQLEGKVFFPPDLFPVVSHPLVQKRGEAFVEKLLVHRLYSYLDFTEVLEHQIVNPVVSRIAHDQTGMEISEERRLDAYKIYIDEGYHALFSVDMKRQVEKATGITSLYLGTPNFLKRLNYIQSSVDSNLREIIKLFWTIISETLITSILTDVPKNKNVVTPVREIILDHARDESRHHAYFASLLSILWFQLKPKDRSIIGSVLPEVIFAFLEPDITAIKYYLEVLGLENKEIETLVEESYPQTRLMLGIKKGASATLKCLENSGIFEEAYTAEGFRKSGLLS